MGFYSYLLSKIRGIRYSISGGFGSRLYTFGAFYQGSYRNFHHDPNPTILCMHSDGQYTHGLNVHYLQESDRAWLIKTIYMMRKYSQNITGLYMYNYIKMQRYNIIKTCYRKYHTGMCRYKMCSSGINPSLDKLVYPSSDPFIRRLNEAISPPEMAQPPREVAYSQQELQDRIIEGMNAIPIPQRTLAGNAPQPINRFGLAQWLKR